MTYLELIQNTWNSDESELGFYCVNIFECSEKNPELKELLENNILKDNELGPSKPIEKEVKEAVDYYGPILLNKIDRSDFKKLDFTDLKLEFQKYWKDEDWREDLQIFKKNFELAISNLSKFKLSTRFFYYINSEHIDSKKLTDPNFFTYFVCVISTEKESNQIITLTFGLD